MSFVPPGRCVFQDSSRLRPTLSAGVRFRREGIAGAAPAFRVADEDSTLDERQDVPQGGVLGALGDLRVLGRRELAVEQAVEDEALAVVEGDVPRALPEACL